MWGISYFETRQKNGIVLIGINDYYAAVENLLSDKSKLKEIFDEPIPARLSSIQRYLTTERR